MTPGRTFNQIVAGYSPGVRRLALDARAFIRDLLPGVDETVDMGAPVIGYRYAPGYRGLVCTLILSKAGVKVGIVGGAALDDPFGLLAGSGKVHRHIVLTTAADLRRRGVKELVQAAARACRERIS